MYLVTLFHQLVSLPQAKAWLEQQLFIPLLQYDARVRELKVAVQNLNTKKEDVGRKVDEEENRYGRGIPDRVKNWIQEVDEIISEHRHFQNDEPHYLATFDLSGTGGLPNPWERHRLSRKASDITKKVNGLLQRAEQDWLSYWVAPSTAAFLSVVGYEVFPSREEIVKNIEAALEDSNVRMIGLHGLSGVGKTTLVKKVAQEALKVKMFNVVIMANVTRNPDIKKIQGQIADMLGIKLDEESDIARAARIRKSLENDKKSTLIILDDLWAKVDFNMLGIPSENDDGDGVENVKMAIQSDNAEENVEKGQSPNISSDDNQKIHDASNGMKQKDALSHYKGCKVLLISESKQVLLLSHMEGKGKSIFPMQVLRDKEAKKLFKKKAEIGDTNFKFEKLAAQIVEKCEGLPMSIVTTARALKNQSLAVWEDVNQQLEREKFTGAPEFSTKLSYELLENDELKYTFLLCARMGHDALIMDLVKYCIGLGFLQGIHTAREARNRVYALVEKLKESGLLSNSYSNDHFTMQAIVRSAALSIASKEKQVFTMTKRRIDEWPDEDKLKRYAVISLHHCDIEGFPISINCPRLRVFHIENNGPRLKIPNNFFKGMKELKVLILTGFDLSPLPLSIACLKKLRMLCLEQCVLGKKFSIVGKLKNLRILSFSGSDIEKLPSELKQLTKLQILDISHCSKLQEIPSNVINSLTSLEELYMRNTSIQWNIEGQANQNQNASLSELRHLNQLTTLDIQIPNVAHWPNNLFFDKLNSYKIVIGDLNEHLEMDFKMPEKYEASRFLAVRLKVDFDIHSQKGIKMLFDRVENLLLEDLFDVQDIFYRLNLKGFPYLKHLSIVNNSGIQFLIKPEDREQSEEVFPKLESLYLSNLTKMETICSCELSKPSFDKLKVIKIKICGLLKNVFSFSMVKLLTVLETIEVSECNSLKAIVPGGTQSDSKEIEFPKLRSLMLQSLPGFDGFYPISSIEETKELFHKMVRLKLSYRYIYLLHFKL
ncbi:probable disease resistance protein At4g27220 [Gastrolobium bilobum]|uniref:probable disease resistance protein At4g27220 n=1 Tax=Gastrolobium bilobum TaxID=150636 RepID=UPI002AB020C1|nr:probable disease resistance protein At4g27220 [Gastrolobium bilobum]